MNSGVCGGEGAGGVAVSEPQSIHNTRWCPRHTTVVHIRTYLHRHRDHIPSIVAYSNV